MLHNQDWTPVDLEALTPDAIPATSYKPRGDRGRYDAAHTHWAEPEGSVAARAHYRVAWRKMAANTGERTLIAAIIPPGAAHIDGVFSVASIASGPPGLVDVAAQLAALTSDLFVRAAPKANIRAATVDRLPTIRRGHPFISELRLRYLRLVCMTEAYGDLWASCFYDEFLHDRWAISPEACAEPLGTVDPHWNEAVPLRRAIDRRRALIELDALVAVSLGITAQELTTVYQTQFPVLYGYDRRRDFYDSAGRLIPSNVIAEWRKHGEGDGMYRSTRPGSGVEYAYQTPFTLLDRERDLRQAHEAFSARLSARRSNSA
jgi:hypothetical protein